MTKRRRCLPPKPPELEEIGAPLEDVMGAYRKAIELNPGAAGAMVNLGTIYYRERRFAEAERYYRAAVVADPPRPNGGVPTTIS